MIAGTAARYYKAEKKIENMADVLLGAGYCDIDALSASILGWRDLIRHLDIDLAISDYGYSDSLGISNWIPTVAIGDGFTIMRVKNDLLSEVNGRFTVSSRNRSQAAIKKLANI